MILMGFQILLLILNDDTFIIRWDLPVIVYDALGDDDGASGVF